MAGRLVLYGDQRGCAKTCATFRYKGVDASQPLCYIQIIEDAKQAVKLARNPPE